MDINLGAIVVNLKLEFWYFEVDTIVSCKGSKSALLVLVDRLTKRTKIKKLERKLVQLTSSLIVELSVKKWTTKS